VRAPHEARVIYIIIYPGRTYESRFSGQSGYCAGCMAGSAVASQVACLYCRLCGSYSDVYQQELVYSTNTFATKLIATYALFYCARAVFTLNTNNLQAAAQRSFIDLVY
jgi:hypothetical protein